MYVLQRDAFPALFDVLSTKGYRTLGPTRRDAAIVYEEITSVDDLPIGWTDEQEGGTYRLKKRDDAKLFGYVIGPSSWKQFLFPPKLKLWDAQREGEGMDIVPTPMEPVKQAFLGVRACELSALAIQDKVFMAGEYVDAYYRAQREQSVIIAVNCTQAAKTCFCTSMGTGPKADTGFDVALTEVCEGAAHYFMVEIGSEVGRSIVDALPVEDAQEVQREAAERAERNAAMQITKKLDNEGLKDVLYANAQHPQWDDVARRCLSCANCTMVCPTCFCHTVEDVTDLTGDHAERWRYWDSCFSLSFSYIHGGNVRSSTQARYRQWMTHKLASWQDQFGTSGCVGCGRCITWCPVGIDITQEATAIRENQGATVS